jgi:tetratricopeptide (TPR) repeat protein
LLTRRRLVLAFLGLLAVGVALWFWLRPHPPKSKTMADDEDDAEIVPAVVNPGYVSIGVCGECHIQRAAEFQRTRHFLACTLVDRATAPGFAPGRGLIPTRDPSVHFEMTRTGDSLLATGVQATPSGETRTSYRIGLVYGAAGTSDEMYLAWQDDRLYNPPVAWLYSIGCWGHATDTISAREVNPRCLECHNTWIAHVPGTTNQYRRDDMLPGVTCERCHGPAREHVTYHRTHPNDPAHAILHPGTLTRDRLLEVCTQCHSNATRPRGPAFSYRPGQPLEAFFRTNQNKYPEDDQVANQVQSLRRSQCFQKSEMTCITCHDPHQPQQPETVRRACLRCHTAAACTDQPRQPAAVRGDCVGCHMPARVWMNVHYHTADDQYVPVARRSDHRIAIHPEAKQAVVLAWLRTQGDAPSRAEAERLGPQLAGYWLNEAEQRRRAARLLATIGALREALKADPNPRTRQLLQEAIARQAEWERLVQAAEDAQRSPDQALELLKKLLEIKPDSAKAHADLGALYFRRGQRDEAIAHWHLVGAADPDESYGVTMLGWLADLDGRVAEAEALFAKADQIEPYDATIHHLWGMALLKQGRWADAAVHFQQALAIDPKHAGANQGLSEALSRQGRTEEAERYARRAARSAEVLAADPASPAGFPFKKP